MKPHAKKAISFAAAVLATAMAGAAPATAADYAFDKKGQHASITFRIKHLGYSWMTGRFDNFDGTISYDDKNPDASKVKVEIDTASISTNHGERDKHLRGPDYLDVATFPKATFESTSVKMSGDGKAKI
ncbi:MAG: YceI family protein, partial [Hyphomicrobium sp.]